MWGRKAVTAGPGNSFPVNGVQERNGLEERLEKQIRGNTSLSAPIYLS